ncbi:MAG TPA: T9SS type A sorting domain-containing protein, partial [Flavipsychrobacter sp.]
TTSVATLTVNPLVLPSATVSVSDDDICMGSSVTFTPTPTNGGTNPTYVWKRNGAAVATGSTYTTTALANGDLVWCDMTSNIACPSPKTVKSDNAITMKVTQYSTPTITVTSDVGTSWCSGKPAVFRSNITNGGTKPAYEWQVNGQPVGANIDTYLAAQLLDGDQVRCRMTSNLKCPSPVTVTSNTLTMTINQTTRSSIVITPNPDSVICNNTEVTMYTYYTNAGPTPSFQWMLNGADIPGETGGTMKITSLSNGDMIQCRFISSATCVFPEESLPVSFSVNQLIDPSVGVIVYYVGNETFRFTAIPTNGGANPSYQWYKNTVPIPGATSETYDAVGIEKTDKIHVQMASSEACVNPELLQVNSKIITTGTAELSKTFADMSLYPNPNKGQFNIKGTLNKPVTSKDVMVRITNSLGQTVFTQSYPANGINFNLPIQLQYDLPNGMYQVNIAIDGDVTNLRFVLNR